VRFLAAAGVVHKYLQHYLAAPRVYVIKLLRNFIRHHSQLIVGGRQPPYPLEGTTRHL
jgi:hypothetical protein